MATIVSAPAPVERGAPPGPPEGNRTSEWARKYPPLLALVAAILIAMVVLPSSLNVPQSNPQTTLEFAPVPPDKDKPPPPANGNLSSLGLAGTSGLTTGGLPGQGPGAAPELPAPGTLSGVGKSPRTKRCVGNPPKQTDDPLAPPCVADFQGDNFGSTYQGVTREEVRVLFYIQGYLYYVNTCSDPGQTTPDHQYFDLAQDPQPGEHCVVRALRVWQQYFNDRYQTYGRFVHFYVYFSGQGSTAEERKADAADNFATVHPFSVISTSSTFNDEYLQYMAQKGVLAFDSSFGRDAGFYSSYPGHIWGYFPTEQTIAKMYVGLLCKKVVGQPVSSSGNAGDMGKPRKYGLIYTSDPGHPELRAFKDLVVAGLKSTCGLDLSNAPQHTFPAAGYEADASHNPTYADTAMADFRSQNVTTIIWPGGLETNFSKSASRLNYFPEWILAGDRLVETDTSGTFQDQTVWDHAFVMTNLTAVADIRQSPCYLAYRETDPNSDDIDAQVSGCEIYDYIRQMFTGIQVAGPKLTPASMDSGFHAIPRVASTSPLVPACFYEQGDYTCIKDGMLEKWDSQAADDQGCWRMIENGKRYFAEIWPDGNIDAQYSQTDDACNTYDTSFVVNQNPPDPNNP